MTEGRSNWTKEEIDLVVSLRNQGHAWRAIARHLGRSDTMCRFQYERQIGQKVSGDSCSPHKSISETSHQLMVNDIRAERAPNSEPLSIGHPVIMKGLWNGLERWRDSTDTDQ
ncbi:hypothetical protein APT_00796 [Acetobacter pasteurianus NBRC 101655]|uniref:SANT/Myb-like DNA-binding domain-containing protein n=1 Tax=Acetobacter pasteurianus TaxID=438 RepID=UPI00054EDA6F|nr:hypothetical protein APT_00796 [Acetobacter pasteurianus NBRC 101655]